MNTASAAQRITANRTPRRGHRRLLLLVCSLLGSLALLLAPVTTSAASAVTTMSAVPRAWCYNTNSAGSALLQVDPPNLSPTQSTVPVYVGGDSQTVQYRPYLQRWNGSSWSTIATGPLYTGLAQTWYVTNWSGTMNGTTQWTLTKTTDRRYYRVTAEIWWIADRTHPGDYVAGSIDHRQYDYTYGWHGVSYCTY